MPQRCRYIPQIATPLFGAGRFSMTRDRRRCDEGSGSDGADRFRCLENGPALRLLVFGLAVLVLSIAADKAAASGPCSRECAVMPSWSAPLRATGNEPSWRLDLGATRLRWTTVSGPGFEAPAPCPVAIEDGRRYDVAGRATVITVFDRVCHDNMSGMPHPHAVEVLHEGRVFHGCGGKPAALLHGAEWRVEAIDGSAIDAAPPVTLRFGSDGRLDGHGSCNGYRARYSLDGETLSFGRPASTERACTPSVMQQESRFFETLAQVRRFEIAPDGALVLHGEPGRTVMARRGQPLQGH